MKRLVVIIVSALLGAFLITAGVPPVPAHALNCTNSLTCNPANAPILTELGIITTKGGTSIVAPAAVTTGGGAAAMAGVNWSYALSNAANVLFGGAITALGVGYMASNGWGDQQLTPNPDFDAGPSGARCTSHATIVSNTSTLAPGTWSGQPTCNLVESTLRVLPQPGGTPARYVLGSTYRLGEWAFVSGTTGTKSSVSFVYTRSGGSDESSTGTAAQYPNVAGRCYSATGSPQSGGIAVGLTRNSGGGTATATCPLTGAAHIVLWSYGYDVTSEPKTTVTQTAGVLYDSVFGGIVTGDGTISGDVRSTVECMKPDGTIYNVYKVMPFIVVDDDPVPVPDARCAPGELAVGGKVEWLPTGTTEWFDVLEADVPPAVKEWMTDYPNCFGMAQACAIQLFKKNTAGDWETCGTIGEYCEDWASTDPDVMHQRYQCRYGGKVTSIDTCSAYRKPSAGVLPNTDKQGNPIPPNAPPPSQPINPKTDEQLVELGLQDIIDTEGTGQCWPTGWGVLNPLSWVYMPVTCALEWAFKPRTDVMTQRLTLLDTRFKESTLGQWSAVIAAPMALTAPSGCEGLAVDMSWVPYANAGTHYFLPACSGQFFAPIAPYFFWLTTFGTIAGGFWKARSLISGIVGAKS